MTAYDVNYSGSMDDEAAYVAWLMLLFSTARNNRINFEVMWEESAALCWPEYRNSFTFGHVRAPGIKYTEFQVDTAGSIASHRFMAICDALLTPQTSLWSIVQLSNRDLMRDRTVQEYCSEMTKTLWRQRYAWQANFTGNNQQNWQALGVFGNMGMFTHPMDTKGGLYRPGLCYMGTSPGEMYVLRNHQGRVDGYIRHFRWVARQAYQRWGDKVHETIKAALHKNDSYTRWDFLEFCLPNTEYDPLKIFDPVANKPWVSVYVSVQGFHILEKQGYRTFPWACGAYMLAPEEDYARGPAQMVLPDLKTLNAEKAMFLRQGHKAADPAYLIADDGLVTLKTAPRSFNYGGLSKQGAKLAQPLDTGQIQITEEMLEASAKCVNDAFLVSLFPELFSDQKQVQMAVRQVIEQSNLRGMFLAPLGRQYSEYLGPMQDRELDILSQLRMLPKRPPIMKEAKGEYDYQYCSALARAAGQQKVEGFMKLTEFYSERSQATGDPSLMDVFEFDEAAPEMAEALFVPVNWLADPQKIAKKRQGRAQQAEREAQVKELPGRAAMEKAKAITAKALTGGNTGGTLSGVPTGQMPMMPGQTSPGGRAFGQPGAQ